MVQTAENIIKIQQAATSGNYQIVCPSIYGDGDYYGASDVIKYNPNYSSNKGWSTQGQYITTLGASEYLHTHKLTIDATSISGSTGNAGSSGAHNNMPPYLTVYCWKRTE